MADLKKDLEFLLNYKSDTPPAQSDAPSAERPEIIEYPDGSFSFRGSHPSQYEIELAEAYAALRTARVQSDYVTERTYHAAWEKRAMQAEAETIEFGKQRNMWKGIVTAGCDKHKDSPEEEYPADCFICQAAKVAQLERECNELGQEVTHLEIQIDGFDGLRDKLTAAESALSEARERAQQWVKVSERLPNPEHTVLWCKVPVCEPPIIGSIEDGDFEYATDFTHWMAMPNEFWPGASGAAGKGEANG